MIELAILELNLELKIEVIINVLNYTLNARLMRSLSLKKHTKPGLTNYTCKHLVGSI